MYSNCNSMQNQKKMIGMYNSSNPLINATSKNEISSILSSYFESQSSKINSSISDIVSDKIEPIFAQQSLQLEGIRVSLSELYQNYIANMDIDDIDSFVNEQIKSLSSQFTTVKNQCNSYTNKINSINNYQQETKNEEDIDAAMNQIDSIIHLVETNQINPRTSTDNNDVNMDNNIIENIRGKLEEIEKMITYKEKESNENQYEILLQKLSECIDHAKKKMQKEDNVKNKIGFLSLQNKENTAPKFNIDKIKQFRRNLSYY